MWVKQSDLDYQQKMVEGEVNYRYSQQYFMIKEFYQRIVEKMDISDYSLDCIRIIMDRKFNIGDSDSIEFERCNKFSKIFIINNYQYLKVEEFEQI